MKKVFITGIAGFIGFHTALKYQANGWEVWGVDNFNEYYDIKLKATRANILWEKDIRVVDMDIRSKDMTSSMMEAQPDLVIHLAHKSPARFFSRITQIARRLCSRLRS